jgi:hypothetical protein
MMFLDCPAYLDPGGAARCGLPAEVRCRFIMHSTDGPAESAMIRCPAGHWFNGAIESLTLHSTDQCDRGTAAVAASVRRDNLTSRHDRLDGSSGFAVPAFPRSRSDTFPRPNTAPAYYLGRPARVWITALRPRGHTASQHPTGALEDADLRLLDESAVHETKPLLGVRHGNRD